MPQNPSQFQHSMSFNELSERYGTEAQCEQARWPDGFVCPACGGREHSRFLADGRRYWQCSQCRTQSTVCSGTVFHASKLSLTTWFQAIYLVTQNKNNISALSLKRHLGVAYTTAWRVKHKTMISGTYHHVDFAKYRHRHLDEAQYRLNHRFDLASLVGRLADACVHTAPCAERWLRLAEIGAAEGSS